MINNDKLDARKWRALKGVLRPSDIKDLRERLAEASVNLKDSDDLALLDNHLFHYYHELTGNYPED